MSSGAQPRTAGDEPANGGREGAVDVLLMRHGQSEWNAVRRWQGDFDSPLTALGRAQAKVAAARLAELGIEFGALWASDLERAAETAAVVGAALGLGAPVLDARLREAHAGEWEGLTPDVIERDWPGWLAAHHRPPTFEPFERVVARTTEALTHLAEVAAHHGHDRVLVVAHSGVIRSFVRHLGVDDWRVPNLGGVWVGFDPVGRSWRLGAAFDPEAADVDDTLGEEPGDDTIATLAEAASVDGDDGVASPTTSG